MGREGRGGGIEKVLFVNTKMQFVAFIFYITVQL